MPGRIDEVGVQHGRKDPIGVDNRAGTGEELFDAGQNLRGRRGVDRAVLPRHEHERCARDVLGEIATLFNRKQKVGAVHHQRRDPDRGEHRPHVHAIEQPEVVSSGTRTHR